MLRIIVIAGLFGVCDSLAEQPALRLFDGTFGHPATHATLKGAPKTIAVNMPTTALKYVKPKYLN
ncbi:MAG: hypothetical protein ABGW96_01130 [Methylophilaceae bacterium]|jgi:hypothetical protein|nr:hypothetical protein [Methylophilaceae bacterium]